MRDREKDPRFLLATAFFALYPFLPLFPYLSISTGRLQPAQNALPNGRDCLKAENPPADPNLTYTHLSKVCPKSLPVRI